MKNKSVILELHARTLRTSRTNNETTTSWAIYRYDEFLRFRQSLTVLIGPTDFEEYFCCTHLSRSAVCGFPVRAIEIVDLSVPVIVSVGVSTECKWSHEFERYEYTYLTINEVPMLSPWNGWTTPVYHRVCESSVGGSVLSPGRHLNERCARRLPK